jgi:tRNA U34 2-thiouridine synthase MnmA/TrmU
VTKDSFKANTLNFGTTQLTYGTNIAQNKDFNVNGNKSIKLNTGFVSEGFNVVIKELIMSENIWIHENNSVYPLKAKTESLQMKKSVNDKLIDYAIDFEYSFDTINSIR